jgi:hypothetical protein
MFLKTSGNILRIEQNQDKQSILLFNRLHCIIFEYLQILTLTFLFSNLEIRTAFLLLGGIPR